MKMKKFGTFATAILAAACALSLSAATDAPTNSAANAAAQGAQNAPATATADSRKTSETPDAKKNLPQTFLFLSRQSSNMDFVWRVPPNKITFNTVKKVYKNEYLNVFTAFANMCEPDGSYNITFSVSLVSPDGKENLIEKQRRISGKSAGNFVIAGGCTTLLMEDSDALGGYKFRITAESASGKKSALETDFTLADFDAIPEEFPDKKTYAQAVQKYNATFAPELLYSLYKSKFNNTISPQSGINYAQYMFFKEAFKTKPFLARKIAEEFDTATNAERLNDIILLTALGEAKLISGKEMTDSEKSLVNAAFSAVVAIPSPYEKTFAPHAFELLWNEFYARGNYAPVEKTMSYLKYEDAAKSFVEHYKVGTLKTLDKKTSADALKYLSAALSLLGNYREKLAGAYVDYYRASNKMTPEKLSESWKLCAEFFKIKKQKQQEVQAAQSAAAKAKENSAKDNPSPAPNTQNTSEEKSPSPAAKDATPPQDAARPAEN